MNETYQIEVGPKTEFVDYDHSMSCIDCPHNDADKGIMPKAKKAIRTTLRGSVLHIAVCSSGCYARLMSGANLVLDEGEKA